MKLRQQILDLFEEEKGSIKIEEGFIIEREGENISVTINNFRFHLFSHYQQCHFFLGGSPNLEDIPNVAVAAKRLADYIGMEFNVIETIEKPVEVERKQNESKPDEDRYQLGKAEAYEKILFGRKLTIEKE